MNNFKNKMKKGKDKMAPNKTNNNMFEIGFLEEKSFQKECLAITQLLAL